MLRSNSRVGAAASRGFRLALFAAVACGLSSGCDTGSSSGGSSAGSSGPRLSTAQFIDVDGNGVDQGDLLVLTFDASVFIGSEAVLAFEPDFAMDSLGTSPQQRQSIPGSNRLELILGAGASFTPGASGIQVKATGSFNVRNLNETAVRQGTAPVTITDFTATAPTLLAAFYNDADRDGTLNAGDTVLAVFDKPIAIPLGATVAGNFDLPVGTGGSPDSFGAGATLTAADSGTENRAALITLGAGAVLTVSGAFDAGTLVDGSPSGLQMDLPDITDVNGDNLATDGTVVDMQPATSHRLYTQKAAGVFVGNTDGFSADVTPSGYQGPQGMFHFSGTLTVSGNSVTVDMLFVADTGNHRVLIYANRPTGNHASADGVLGQASLNEGLPNRSSATTPAPTANTLWSPVDVHFHAATNQLYVSDQDNHRVLVFDGVIDGNGDLALTDGMAASRVLGQPSFVTRESNQGGNAPTSRTLSGPGGLHVAGGQLAVADTGNHRVLIWSSLPASSNAAASSVLGQASFVAGSSNQGGAAGASTLSSPEDVFLDGDLEVNATTGAVLVADTGNHRVLVFETFSPATGAAADRVLGQPFGDFTAVTPATTATGLDTPTGVQGVEDGGTDKIYVVDRGNHRLMVYVFDGSDANDLAVAGNATGVAIGQADDTSGDPNQGGAPGADSLADPWRVSASAVTSGLTPIRLYVADSQNHRVLDHATLPDANGVAADLVQGQASFVTSRAKGHVLNLPAAVVIVGGRMVVADTSNHRVLIYDAVPTEGDPVPDVILGQADAFSTLANRGGVASLSTMSAPEGVATDGTRLLVSDTGNNRLLMFDDLSTLVTGDAADRVLGQSGVGTVTANNGGLSAASLDSPTALWIDGTALYVCDRDNHRVLLFEDITALPTPAGASADRVFGQADFASNQANHGDELRADTLFAPGGVLVVDDALFVSDTGNHRVLVWRPIPTGNGASATEVIGQSSFVSSTGSASTAGLRGPRGLTSDGTALCIADSGNHRVLFFNQVPLGSRPTADSVLGQASFSGFLANRGNDEPTPFTLKDPQAAVFNGLDLWIVDQGNSRVIRVR